MDNDLYQISKKSKVRTDKLKEHYSNIILWIFLIIAILFAAIGFYSERYYPNSFFSLAGFFLTYLALIIFLVFIIPLFTRLIIPILIQSLIYLSKILSSLIKSPDID